MLSELPPDQSAMVLYRLGAERVAEIEKEAKGVSSFYNLCIRAMGENLGQEMGPRIPNKTQAWIEVMHNKLQDDMPEFSHPMIEEAIMSFGGWQQALDVFRRSDLEKAKYKFFYAYADVIGG